MYFKIHRGSHEIGGTCIEILEGKHRLLLDLGLPLDADRENAESLLPEIPDIFSDSPQHTTAIIISHAHQDHWGLAGYVKDHVQVFASHGTIQLINTNKIFIRDTLVPKQVQEIELDKNFVFGPFLVTPHLVDHSAPDALAFHITNKIMNISLFYSGDFRNHGRKHGALARLIKSVKGDGGAELLLIEGTTLSRLSDSYPSEKDIQKKFYAKFQQSENTTFVFSSGQNIDRWVTIYNAARDAGKTIIIDLYTAWVIKSLINLSDSFPKPGWKHDDGTYSVRTYYWKNHCDALDAAGQEKFILSNARYRIKVEEIIQDPGKYVFMARSNRLIELLIKRFSSTEGMHIIWSLWSGYLNPPEHTSYKPSPIKLLAEKYNIPITHIHTSGHAGKNDIVKLIEGINPHTIIPIHTEVPEAFLDLDSRTRLLEDGVEYEMRELLRRD
ncbi:MAG: hypothetical protein K9M55_07370 [Candidatus Marinimicrobia bacterium]|nr:hypothetical protein [Candidatus Neomarinimicrobiota bacterium]